MTDQTVDNGTNPDVQNAAANEADEAAALWAEIQAEKDGDKPAEAGDDVRLEGDTVENDVRSAPAEAGDGDIWKNAPPEAREAYEKLKTERSQLDHETRSYEGRVAARQAKIADLTKQLEAFKSKPASTDDDPLNQIATEFPELHAPISKALEGIASRQEQAEAAQKGRIEAELNAETQRYVEEVKAQTERLTKDHPDYLEVIKKNTQAWQSWVEDQPKAIREAVARNSEDITDAKAAAQVISAFKAYLNPAPKPNPQADRRQRQIGSTASPSGGARGPVVSGIPENDDPEAIWQSIQREKERKQR